MSKTNLDLFVSAHNAAKTLLAESDPHSLLSAAMDIFEAEEHFKADWTYWHQALTNQLAFLRGISTQKTTGQTVADAAAAKALADKTAADAAEAKALAAAALPAAATLTPAKKTISQIAADIKATSVAATAAPAAPAIEAPAPVSPSPTATVAAEAQPKA